MPQAKYDYAVMGKVAKNSRNKAQTEVIALVKADDGHNFETVTNQLNTIINQQKNISQRLSIIEQKLGIQKQIP
jgi:hypothetical protein